MSNKNIENILRARKILKDQNNNQNLNEMLKEKLNMLRNIDLTEETLKDKSLKIMLDKLTEEEKEKFDDESAAVTESYSTILNAVADALEDPKQRDAILEEIKRRM